MTSLASVITRRVTWRSLAMFFFSSRRRHTRLQGDWSSDVCSSDLREGISQTRNHLRHRQVRVAQACPDHPGPTRTVKFEDTLEVAEKLRHAHGQEVLRAPLGCRLLFLVGIAVSEGVMGMKNLQVEIQDGELQLMRPQPARLIRRREPQAAAQVQQDIRRLRDELRADLEDRRRKGRPLDVSGFEYLQNGGHAAAFRSEEHTAELQSPCKLVC